MENTERGPGIGQEQFVALWQSFYAHCHATITRTETLMGNAGHEVPDSYKAYMTGVINGGLVVAKQFGQEMNLEFDELSELLNKLNDVESLNKLMEDEGGESLEQEGGGTEGTSET